MQSQPDLPSRRHCGVCAVLSRESVYRIITNTPECALCRLYVRPPKKEVAKKKLAPKNPDPTKE